jgi:hypothetical protein
VTGPGMMTRREVAVMFGVTSEAVARWERAGLLTGQRGTDGKIRYPRADVEALYRSGRRSPNARPGPPPGTGPVMNTRTPGPARPRERVASRSELAPARRAPDCRISRRQPGHSSRPCLPPGARPGAPHAGEIVASQHSISLTNKENQQ